METHKDNDRAALGGCSSAAPGYAFPMMPTQELWERGMTIECGMTLREYYAGQAMCGLRVGDWSECKDAAKWCFDMADAMMAARHNEKLTCSAPSGGATDPKL